RPGFEPGRGRFRQPGRPQRRLRLYPEGGALGSRGLGADHVRRAAKLWFGLGVPALALGALFIVLTLRSHHEHHAVLTAVFGSLAGWSFVAGGLVAWTRRPHNG